MYHLRSQCHFIFLQDQRWHCTGHWQKLCMIDMLRVSTKSQRPVQRGPQSSWRSTQCDWRGHSQVVQKLRRYSHRLRNPGGGSQGSLLIITWCFFPFWVSSHYYFVVLSCRLRAGFTYPNRNNFPKLADTDCDVLQANQHCETCCWIFIPTNSRLLMS